MFPIFIQNTDTNIDNTKKITFKPMNQKELSKFSQNQIYFIENPTIYQKTNIIFDSYP